MIYQQSELAVALFLGFIMAVLAISFFFAKRTTSASGYFAAGGTIHWSVNGIAFAGDYLSAASFLGISGMIATVGFDGFLYSIGFLAGWAVALFLVAEPMKRLGRFTFTDALNAKFQSRGVQLVASLSTLIISVIYLIPQMVGAGVLVTPLLGIPHYVGVMMVGIVVTIIVATAGMISTTYVQFMKGGLLLIFSTVLVVNILGRGIQETPVGQEMAYHHFQTLPAHLDADGELQIDAAGYQVAGPWRDSDFAREGFVRLMHDDRESVWQLKAAAGGILTLEEALFVHDRSDGTRSYNGGTAADGRFFKVGHVRRARTDEYAGGPLGVFDFLSVFRDSDVVLWKEHLLVEGEERYVIYAQNPLPGERILRPGLMFKVQNSTWTEKLNFVSLMLALFCGTAALPHILIRYYTVPSQAAARKSTIVAIGSIGFFYLLTLFLGLGAMVNGQLNIMDSNMAVPLLARSFGEILFAIISSIAFFAVLGTVSGLIVAAAGAVAHDLMDRYLELDLEEHHKVVAGRLAAIVVGCVAIYFGIVFEGVNVSFLAGWAFAVTASTNLPAIIMMLFWKRTTSQGIIASILIGLASSIGLILLSPDMYVRYGKLASDAPIALDNPGIISIPVSFLALVIVSLLTQNKDAATS